MKRLTYEDRVAQIRPLYEQGMNYTQLANEVGVATSTMSTIMAKAIARGDIKSKRVPALRESGVKVGSLSTALKNQSAQFNDWLITETRGNITVAELAVSIMLDAFYDERGE